MSLMVCASCGTAYLPADLCPHCGGGFYQFDWEEDEVPKATVEGGGSDYSEGVPAEPVAEEKPKTPRKPAAKPSARLLPADADEDE